MVDFSSWLSSAGRLAAAGLLVATLSACGNSGGSALLGVPPERPPVPAVSNIT
mgnify:CR=1 FL=1